MCSVMIIIVMCNEWREVLLLLYCVCVFLPFACHTGGDNSWKVACGRREAFVRAGKISSSIILCCLPCVLCHLRSSFFSCVCEAGVFMWKKMRAEESINIINVYWKYEEVMTVREEKERKCWSYCVTIVLLLCVYCGNESSNESNAVRITIMSVHSYWRVMNILLMWIIM